MIQTTLNLVAIRSMVTTLCALLIMTLLSPQHGFAQPSCSGTLDTTMYTTTMTSTTGNESGMVFNFPKFPVSANTLYGVDIKSSVTVWNDMNVTNNYGSPLTVTAKIYRTDDFYTDASPDYPGSAFGSPYNFGSVASGQTKSVTTVSVNASYKMNDSIYSGDANGDNLASYTGSGSMNLYYSTGTSVITTPNNPLLAAWFDQIHDQMQITVTYYYCNPGTLALNLLSFTAVREDPQTAQLAWSVTNEVQGSVYHVQVGTDGASFTDYAAVNADPVNSDGSYSYNYPILPNASGKLYFRLRISNPDGSNRFSSVSIINLDNDPASGFAIFPNPPSSFINLVLPGDDRSWQVDIIAADGRLVQRNNYYNTSLAVVNFNTRLAQGTYFVRAVNALSGTKYTGSFVIAQ